MNLAERKSFLDSFDFVFTDCDGVLWNTIPRTPFPQSSEGIDCLKKLGKKVVYVSNNSVRPINAHILKTLGFKTDEKYIVHPAKTISEYLKNMNFNGLIYCLTSTHFQNYLKNEGFNVYDEVGILSIIKISC